ncbi:unnamed protein product [Cuscuta campestris]|uniref:RRM domain-containing protein n=1 Tax=Cuscuta campestris TaxID=132261 RepID=A0A484L248_9ASTE|nr:unnamed protein product [Cuscuta campestris]
MDLTNEELKAYFENYGTVTDTDIHPTRGFGFVTFDSNEGVRNSLENRVHYLKNKRVEAKVAEPRTGSFQSFHYCGLAQARVPYYYGNLIKPNAFGYSTYLPMCHCLSTRYQSLRPLSDFRKNLSGSVKLLLHLDEVEEGNVGHDTKSDDKEAPYIEEDACRLGVEKLISIEEFDKAS